MEFRTVVLSILAFVTAPAAYSQAPKAEPEPRYDPATVVNLMAAVTEIRDVPRGSPLSGIHLMVKSDKETLEVYLAPASFLKEMGISFSVSDQVHVVGSKVKTGDRFIVLAREVRNDNNTLYLRDQRGNPNWPPEKSKT